jgi:AcrR family transcriptional regulator
MSEFLTTMAPPLRNRTSSREALLDAAAHEFADKGYEATKVSDIAERAGVTTGALYAHFDGKLELLMATLGLASVSAFWQKVSSAAALPWSEARVELSRSLARKPDARALLLLDTIVLARRDEEIAEQIRDGMQTYLSVLKRATDAGVAAGVIDPPYNSDDLSALFSTITLGVLVLARIGGPRPSHAAFAQLIDALLQSHAVPVDEDEPGPIARVRSRAETAERSRDRLHDAITEAAADGYSLRQIGVAAGLSHERVRQILADVSSSVR